MKAISKLGLGVALLSLVAGCGSEAPTNDNHAVANEQNIVDNGMIVDPEIPNAAAQTNVAAVPEPAVEPAVTKEPAAVKAAPPPPPPPAPKAAPKTDAPKAAPKAAPKTEPSPPPKAECLPEHRAAGHC
jgi:hypothetical protein